jgi:hypothetical protein
MKITLPVTYKVLLGVVVSVMTLILSGFLLAASFAPDAATNLFSEYFVVFIVTTICLGILVLKAFYFMAQYFKKKEVISNVSIKNIKCPDYWTEDKKGVCSSTATLVDERIVGSKVDLNVVHASNDKNVCDVMFKEFYPGKEPTLANKKNITWMDFQNLCV